jgi:SAM-dependent methyltransferase
MFRKLKLRAYTMSKMVGHVEDACAKNNCSAIIETGTARIKDNWGGDGQSTLVWEWLCQQIVGLRAVSIDITPEHVAAAREQVKRVQVIEGDSIKTLAHLSRELVENCRLLYLDSFDWHPEHAMDSMFHHMAELATVYADLPSGCLIAVDDRHSRDQGKHFMVQAFFEKLGIEPLFAEYQIGWVKP